MLKRVAINVLIAIIISNIIMFNQSWANSKLVFENKFITFTYTGDISTQGFYKLKYLIWLNLNKIEDKTIRIIINSPGGSVRATLDLINYLNSLKFDGYKVSILVKEFCASACFTFMHVGDFRGITTKSIVMTHRSYLALPFNITFYTDGTAELDKIMAEIECSTLPWKNCVQTMLQLKENETWFNDVNTLLKLGIVHYII